MPTLFAQPYDISATGFSFETLEDYRARAATLRNAHGQLVEEFEIQFIDGAAIDGELAQATGLNQANLAAYLGCVERWDDWEKHLIIIAVGHCGYPFDPDCAPEDYDIDVYHARSLVELAEDFVDDGLLGDIPENIRPYFDCERFARDLAVDYSEIEIAGQRLVYRAG